LARQRTVFVSQHRQLQATLLDKTLGADKRVFEIDGKHLQVCRSARSQTL